MNDISNLDIEFKRYLQIMRPYLGLLQDQDTIDICNAWIKRLSQCKKKEKYLRNKYIFSLCFQLAQGVFEEPFNRFPTTDSLSPLNDDVNSDASSEVEYVVINGDDGSTKITYDSEPHSESECFSQNLDSEDNKSNSAQNNAINQQINQKRIMNVPKQTLVYTCSDIIRNKPKVNVIDDDYKNRTNNLIMKLREIKLENERLHFELQQLKEITNRNTKCESCGSDRITVAVDKTTSACCQINPSPSTIFTLQSQLEEVQSSRNVLIETIKHLQEKIHNLNETRKHEIDEIKAAHDFHIIECKSELKKELSELYEKKLQEEIRNFEKKLKELEDIIDLNKCKFEDEKNKMTTEKVKIINNKDFEIEQLKKELEEQKTNIHSILNKLPEPKESIDNNTEILKSKVDQLEKRLFKTEKSKSKCIRVYEAKLANLQREKHLTECSLQLQLVRQRAQVISDVSDESQAELATTLDKLETKYKEIVANVQSTAIQRRVQDQMALDSIVQATIKTENILSHRVTNRSQLSGRTMQNQSRDENGFDSEISSLLRGNKVGNVMVGNKSFGEDSVGGYCLDGERMGQLFERVYIPQRDTGDGHLKK
ncbi:synaptonemal complex protein 1 [Amyelois transitella]|uniref:synaptonemal complex protein 1 n=1 Tax=Amyelois transitella TaxID=680683 RepID=UPI00067B397E|nr:synaptonemal complex protein 1 [Amyelois transitella]